MKNSILSILAIVFFCSCESPESKMVKSFEKNDDMDIKETKYSGTFTFEDSCKTLQEALDKSKTEKITQLKNAVALLEKANKSFEEVKKGGFKSLVEMAEKDKQRNDINIATYKLKITQYEKGEFKDTPLEEQAMKIEEIKKKGKEVIGHILEVDLKLGVKDRKDKYLVSPDKKSILRKL